MRKVLLAVFVLTIIHSCDLDKKQTAVPVANEKEIIKIDSTLITDSSWGPITRAADLSALQKIYGSTNLKDETICGPECADSVDVTKVYPGAKNEFVVYWKDSLYHNEVSFIEVQVENSPYHTITGLKEGSSLQDLLKVNGQKITFSGFSWDYGGYIQSYHKGTLDNTPVLFRLDLPESNDDRLLGDKKIDTDMPAVKKVLDKIVISQVSLSFSKGE